MRTILKNLLKCNASLFTKSHEYIHDNGKIGLSDHAQDMLGDIIHFEVLVEVGDTVDAGETFAEVESVKSVSGIYSPATGVVEAINEELLDDDNAYLANEDAEGAGWIVQLKDVEANSELLEIDDYKKFCEEEH